jgi:hypothetical protein
MPARIMGLENLVDILYRNRKHGISVARLENMGVKYPGNDIKELRENGIKIDTLMVNGSMFDHRYFIVTSKKRYASYEEVQ